MRNFQGPKFGSLAILLQIGFLLIYGFCVRYTDNIDASKHNNTTAIQESKYFYFQDVQGMMFLGFGFLMVFLKKYGYSSIGFNFLICIICIEWGLIMIGVKTVKDRKILINVNSLLDAEFTLAAVLISFGAVLGKLSPVQYVLMALIEIPIITWNEHLGRQIFGASDIGATIFVHTFGAYFGLACAAIISGSISREHENEDSRYDSDLFSMIGTLVLWIFWPSFNSGGSALDAQQRAIVNTVLSLCGSTMMTFAINSFITEDKSGEENIRGKFKMAYIQNATLAGGVGVGACADMMIQPWGALLIGSIVGGVSTIGFHFLTPNLSKIYIHDTCGVNNLHGMPGIIGGLCSAIAAAAIKDDMYGNNKFQVFPNVTGRKITNQAGSQLAALGATLAISITGGLLVGVILRFIPICDKPKVNDLYSDYRFWLLPSEDSTGERKYNDSTLPREVIDLNEIP